ncbi:MAG: hypothetical protein AB3N63_04950, partial [Puniceicoccaceae bacterium]
MATDDDQTRLYADEPERFGELKTGQSLGNYRVIRLLGHGGMGEVYEVEHVELHTRHALKLINPDIMSRGESAERFRREAQ